MKTIRLLYGSLLALGLVACSGTLARIDTGVFQRDQRAEIFYIELDRVIQQYGAGDGASFKVDGFPYMRTNRFLLGIKDRPHLLQNGHYWARQMLNLGLVSRLKELSNLPETAIQEMSLAIGETLDRQTLAQKAAIYASQLFTVDQNHGDFVTALKHNVEVPDEYSSLARLIGLYPLAGIPVTVGTAVAYNRYKEWHQTEPTDLEILGALIQYVPGPLDHTDASDLINRLYGPNSLDAFGLPILMPVDEYQLALKFAPAITQDVAEDYDRIGRIVWQENRIAVDKANPSVYYYTSRAFLDGHPVLQLNYAFWYSERAGKNAPWIERGPLDGITYRVTLDRFGLPAMVDIMNSCGCYFFFVPRKEAIAKIKTKPGEIAPLVPTWMPAEFPRTRMLLRINSGWHQVQNIGLHDSLSNRKIYKLIPYETLESLQHADGQNESVFTPDGIMKDSRRIEPYIFFSMGIADIGYMRQRGHHAIKMVGRGHFTDPDLYDDSFQFN